MCISLIISEAKLFPMFSGYFYFLLYFFLALLIHVLCLDPSVFLVLCLTSLQGNY